MNEVCMPKKNYLCKNGCTVQIIGFQEESDDEHVGRKGIITNPDGSDGGVGYWTSYGLFKNDQKRNYDFVGEMHAGIYVESLHYAGLKMFESKENPSDNDIDELIEAKAKELIAEIVEVSKDCYDSVQIDDNYKCQSTNGIGFVGRSQAHVLWVANQLAAWAEAMPELDLIK